jgi:hypothetical protein
VTTQAQAIDRLAAVTEAGIELLTDAQRRERDAEGRRIVEDYRRARRDPHKLSFLAVCQRIPGFLALYERKIPDQFWAIESARAVISCPCGETPSSGLGEPIACAGEDCGRHYVYDGENVRVAGGPNAPQDPEDDPTRS